MWLAACPKYVVTVLRLGYSALRCNLNDLVCFMLLLVCTTMVAAISRSSVLAASGLPLFKDDIAETEKV